MGIDDGTGQVVLASALGVLAVALAVMVVLAVRLRAVRRHAFDDRAQLAALQRVSHEWSWQADADLVLRRCSPAVADLLGHDPSRLVGRSMLDLVHDEDADLVRRALSVDPGRGWNDLELRWQHVSGDVVTLAGSALAVVDRAGAVTGLRGSWREVTGDAVVRRRLASVTHRVRRLTTTGTLDVALQPIVDLSAGRLVGLEALARFPDAEAPEAWFAQAHEAGVGVELELHALQLELALLRLPDTLPATAYLSVNASPGLVLDPGFHALLRAPDLPLDRLVVEITEHAAVTRYDEIRAELLPYRERGLRLAVDDTGAGYASFNHVLSLRPDLVKLDRSLLADIDHDPARRAFVTAIVLMALELEAVVVAEGVERTAELDTLRSLGVDAVQGFLLARPSTDPAVWALWSDRRSWPGGGTVLELPVTRSEALGRS